jgi:GAF domain-containing protein
MHLDTLLPEVNNLINDKFLQRDEKLQKICDLLKSKIDYYDWVGFYFRNGEKEELILGPYSGLPTEHTHIPFGKGICGQVAVSNTSFLVPDVTLQDNYIACSSTVKSEIVVPLFVKGKNIGQIDIDSEHLNAFSKADEIFLSAVNEIVATLY